MKKTLWVILLLHIGLIGLSQSVRQAKMCKDCWNKRSAAIEVPDKRANSMWELNRMGGVGKNKRTADYTNFPDVFRPLPENKVEEDNRKEVKRDSDEKRSAQGQFHRAVVFKPSGKRTDECATNSPHVEINDTDYWKNVAGAGSLIHI